MQALDLIERLFAHYGYLVLLFGLPLDAIALPIPPGNTTLTYTGYLSYKGVLALLPALGAAFAGSIMGMTITYWLGYKLGMPLIERYGKWLFLKPEYVEKTRTFYDKYGNRLLLFSYFVPGVRQFIGYFAGIIRVPFRTFAWYAYIGSAVWVAVFVGIGYGFGEQWQLIFGWVERSLKYVSLGLVVLLAAILALKWNKRRLKARLRKLEGEAD
ncbi:DedA family protein [Cohnella thermotolerans]|uniref:DedA family protein n=1 Tax=Cohnella thermotolerans TaxID=329858 RepID=UPI0003FD7EC6|nr:DedA family protein [Cohnella thermotolerans]